VGLGRRVLPAALVVLLLGTTGCGRQAPAGRPPDPAQRDQGAWLVDADAHGAIVLDGRDRTYRGVRRDGTVAWREPADPRAPMAAACAARCPDAVLAGSIASLTEAGTADPQPRLVLDGRSRPVAGITGHKRRVLTALGPHDLVAAVGDRGGRWRLEIRGAGPPTRLAVGSGLLPVWQESHDARVAFLVVVADDPGGGDSGRTGPRNQARWFTRLPGGWRPDGAAIRVTASSACVAGDGRALLLGPAPVLLRRDGRRAPVTDLRHAGTCALAESGGIVAELAQSLGGPHGRVRAFDGQGRVVWTSDLDGEIAVTADPAAPRVAAVAQGTLHEVDLLTPGAVRSRPGVLAARYDGAGSLVVLGPAGTPTWVAATPTR
jgi:hypothetical protein